MLPLLFSFRCSSFLSLVQSSILPTSLCPLPHYDSVIPSLLAMCGVCMCGVCMCGVCACVMCVHVWCVCMCDVCACVMYVHVCGVCACVWCVCINDLDDTQRLSYLLWVKHTPVPDTRLTLSLASSSTRKSFSSKNSLWDSSWLVNRYVYWERNNLFRCDHPTRSVTLHTSSCSESIFSSSAICSVKCTVQDTLHTTHCVCSASFPTVRKWGASLGMSLVTHHATLSSYFDQLPVLLVLD